MKLYKFLKPGLRSAYDNSPWVVGEWRKVPAPTQECVGLNASKYIQDALGYVQESVLAEVEVDGTIIKRDDKWTCERMRIVRTAKWGKEESVKLAVFAARQCLGRYEANYPDDKRPRKAIEAAEKWLKDKTSAAARAAANAAAWAASASRAAAWAASASRAAASAASAAARAAANAAAWAASDASADASDAARKPIHLYALSMVKWNDK